MVAATKECAGVNSWPLRMVLCVKDRVRLVKLGRGDGGEDESLPVSIGGLST